MDYIENPIDISIVLPRYHENYLVIEKTIQRIKNIQQVLNVKIIIVNDSDRNSFYDRDIVKIKQNYPDVIVISNCGNYGKGYSIRRGVDLAKGKYIFYTDIDFPVKENDFFNAYKKIKTDATDLVIGERFSNNKSKANRYRKITSRFFLKIVNVLLRCKVSDSQCPFKMLKADLAKEIFSKQKIKGYAFDAEIIYLAKRLSKDLCQLPVNWDDTRENWGLIKTLSNYSVMIYAVFSIKVYWFINNPEVI
ncbi:glycosyltransferase [Xenorhabdus innexi]|uniref:Bactoprenol glucosyl transferase n=1 Tax=Xenorhabdus innexi TaxID=290109 RepID=A0A1N6MV61_9GAMM|nr:glycosyltransferase [Xenorhabdus innexi]PHM31113.1 bactoprenol glucosyl transferase [Xenorhabdus innexi]SIP72755.1 putative Glycosyl transferase, family 2 [Xenorhabdus innexi]